MYREVGAIISSICQLHIESRALDNEDLNTKDIVVPHFLKCSLIRGRDQCYESEVYCDITKDLIIIDNLSHLIYSFGGTSLKKSHLFSKT